MNMVIYLIQDPALQYFFFIILVSLSAYVYNNIEKKVDQEVAEGSTNIDKIRLFSKLQGVAVVVFVISLASLIVTFSMMVYQT
jgi:hypothetical protein